MNTPTCYYLVKARTALYNSETDEIEFSTVEQKFENSEPILARRDAFRFRNKYIYGILTAMNISDEEIGWNSKTHEIENIPDREIRKYINPYLETGSESSNDYSEYSNESNGEVDWIPPDDSLHWYPSFNNGIWVIFFHNDKELHWADEDNQIVIDKVCRHEKGLPTPPLYLNLEEEFKFYDKYHFDVGNLKTTILFFDDEEFLNEDIEEQDALKAVTILSTPFDWTGYDKAYWWEDDISKKTYKKEAEKQLPITIQEAYRKGEHEFAEFKPALINAPGFKRNIEFEIAKTLCAFLNSKGGYLFIGLNDKGDPVGDEFVIDDKDKFLREFTRIKASYLPQFIAHTIYGEFYQINKQPVFVITVFPSLLYPIFISRKGASGKVIKEFYVRSDAASRHIYDLEELVKYCLDNWKIEK